MIACLPLLAAFALSVTPAKPSVKLSAWVVFDDDGTSFADFKRHAAQLESVSFAWIGCDQKGAVSAHRHPDAGEKAEILSVAHKNGVKVYAMAVNDGFTPAGLELAMASPEAMKAHADALVKIALQDGVDGIDLDYESLNAKDRDGFTKLVTTIADAAHANKLRVVMALHAKESEPGNWDGAQAQDYMALGKAVDSLRVMTYDFHWETSEAGPIAPPSWVDQVMTFSAAQIPPAKLELGIPGYGYDWVGKKADGITWAQWSERTKAHGAATRDPDSQELVLSFGEHKVYFSDGESNRKKFPIVRKLGLNGLVLWRMGSEDPSFWKIFEELSK